MHDLIIDMSQAIINRTAMFTISMDTLECLKDKCGGIQVFGQRVPKDTNLFSRRDDAQRLHGILGAIERGEKLEYPSPARDGMRILYLDPLYTLLGPLTRHDTVMLLDISTVTNPYWHGSNISQAYKLAFDLIARRQPNILSISNNTAETFRVNYGFPSNRVTVVPLYLPRHLESDVTPTYATAPYILFVGSLEERKNIEGAIRVFRLSGLSSLGYQLLVIGGHGHGAQKVEALAGITPGVRLSGFVTRSELASLYAGAAAFLYPSYLEGFGVPLVEALHAGIPSVASFTGAIPEVGGDLVRYADPDDHETLAAHLVEIVTMDQGARQELSQRCRAWVNKRFRFHHYRAAIRAALDDPDARGVNQNTNDSTTVRSNSC